MPSRPLAAGAGAVAALVLAAGAATLLPGAAPQAAAQGLVAYEGCGALLEHHRDALARTATPWGIGWGGPGFVAEARSGVPVPAVAGAAGATADTGSARDALGSGPTGTNLQERGVDEPDMAKTSGGLLLALSQDRLQVLSRGPQPQVLGTAPLGRDAWGAELLVDGDRVLVLVPTHPAYAPSSQGGRTVPYGGGREATRALLFDVADPRRPRLLEELELDGRYLSARLSDGAVRLVTTSTPVVAGTSPAAPYGPEQEAAALEANRRAARSVGLADVLPRLERRLPGGRVLDHRQAVDCSDVRHAASPRGASTLLVTTLDLGQGLNPQDTTGVTTDGELVYASADRLYVATSRWGTAAPAADDVPRPTGGPPGDTSSVGMTTEVSTELHAFDTSAPGRTAYTGSASVPGYVMGRWALSSHDGHLRVATTSSPPWGGDPRASQSMVVVLQEQADGLVETGRVAGLGIGERIYAVRYFGDLATVVTFRQTDPLYVLDLADPTAPALLGELKVPGFSTYLHPVGDDLLLGVGQDADAQGRVTGMQVSLFDLSDRRRPAQLDRLSLGEGWSPAGEDSRAFGYVPDRRTALLPFTRYDHSATGMPSTVALGIRVDGRRLVEAGRLPVSAQLPAERVLHDGEHLHAVSRAGVVTGDLDDFARTGTVAFRR